MSRSNWWCLLGVVLMLLACLVPLAAQWCYFVGPAWMSGENGAAPGLVGSAIVLTLASVVGSAACLAIAADES